MASITKRLRRPPAGTAAGGQNSDANSADGENAAAMNGNVEPADIHSHAKLCLEATVNAPVSTPPLRGELGGLGVGLRTLLGVAPADRCTALASTAVSGGCFPPLRWEVVASRKENKPLSLAVVPGNEGGQADCIGACFHTDWMWPSELYSDRREFVVPLFAKLAAVYIYATEEKDIANSDAAADMPMFGGTSSSQGTQASSLSRRKWKFTGLGYGGCVASVCCLLMPSNFVSSLVTFGSPPSFSAPDGLMPFPHTHLQHSNDLTPHLFNRAAAPRIFARLTGLGYLIPDPPLRMPTLNGRLNKKGEPVDLYRHSASHVFVLTPSPAQVAYGNALRKQELRDEQGKPIAERLPAGSNTGALLVATSALFDRRHGPVPETVLKMMPRQQLHVMPKLEGPGKFASLDIRTQTLRVTIKDYFLPLRVMLNKRIELTPNLNADGANTLQQYLNNNGEAATRRLAADVLAYTTLSAQVPSNANQMPPHLVATAEKVAFLGFRFITSVQQLNSNGGLSQSIDAEREPAPPAAAAAPDEEPSPEQQQQQKKRKKKREGAEATTGQLIRTTVPLDASAQHPPLWVSTQLELCSDTMSGLVGFLNTFKPAVGWDPERVARQLVGWSGGLPVASMVANAFVQSQWLAISVCSAVPKAQLSRHVSTAAIVDGMDSGLRRALCSDDGHHFEWSVAIASATHGVGKSTMIHLLTREVVQSRFGPDDELDRANRPGPARRGAAQEAVLRLKWSWAEAVEELQAQEAAANRNVSIALDRRGSKAAVAPPPQQQQQQQQAAAPPTEKKEGSKRSHSLNRKSSDVTRDVAAPAAGSPARRGGAARRKADATDKAAAAVGDEKQAVPAPADAVEEEKEEEPDPQTEEDAKELLKLGEMAKKHILPPSVLLRLRLDEVFYDPTSVGGLKRLSRYAQVLWLVTDAFTADRLAAVAPRLQHAFASYQQHAIVYCPRNHAAAQPGVKPHPNAAHTTAAASAASDAAAAAAEADRIHVEVVLRRLQREHHLRVIHIDLMPQAMASITAMNQASQHMLNLQRLLMQWMVPRLPIPVDPHTMPGGVDMGSLFTRCDDVVQDYLRTSTECHLMGSKQQKAFLLQQALYRQQGGPFGGRRRGTLGATMMSMQSYDDVDRHMRVVAAPIATADDDPVSEHGGESPPPQAAMPPAA